MTLNRNYMDANTIILHRQQNKTKIRMAEAVFIHTNTAEINIQLLLAISLLTRSKKSSPLTGQAVLLHPNLTNQ